MYFWIAIGMVVISTYLSALSLALLSFSRSALARYMEDRGRREQADWLDQRLDHTTLAVSLLRLFSRIAVFACILLGFTDIGPDSELTWTNLLLAGGIAISVIWLFNAVIAAAIARYAPLGMIAPSMPLLKLLTILLLPFSRVVGIFDEIVKRLTGANLREQEEVEQELMRSIEDSQRDGSLAAEAAAMIGNVVEFSSTDVGEVMTPRTDVEGIEFTDDLPAIRAFIAEAGHSRIPVYTDSLDNIAGILYVKDLISYLGEDAADFNLQPLLRTPLFIPDTKPVTELLRDFQQSEVHLAIVIDEYGGTAGLVTIEDVLEEIVGEIKDEHDPESDEEPGIVQISDDIAEVDGRFHLDDLNEHMKLELPESEEYDTVAGFVLAQCGRVPENGEETEALGVRFTTLTATPTHIERLRIERLDTADITIPE